MNGFISRISMQSNVSVDSILNWENSGLTPKLLLSPQRCIPHQMVMNSLVGVSSR